MMPTGRRGQRSVAYTGFAPRSATASATARGSSRKAGTKPELLLRQALAAERFKYETNVNALPGCPDIVFWRVKVAVFVDGDFWHGRNLRDRLRRLAHGHNAAYWVEKL